MLGGEEGGVGLQQTADFISLLYLLDINRRDKGGRARTALDEPFQRQAGERLPYTGYAQIVLPGKAQLI